MFVLVMSCTGRDNSKCIVIEHVRSSVIPYQSVFFFKQKTAYELRISDWSSDVCSSDLFLVVAAAFRLFDGAQTVAAGVLRGLQDTRVPMVIAVCGYWLAGYGTAIYLGFWQLGRASCRERVCQFV